MRELTAVIRECGEDNVCIRNELVEALVGEVSVDHDDVLELFRDAEVLRADEQQLERWHRGVVVRLECAAASD